MHFVVDGHHRVSAARALGLDTLDARVVEVRTQLEPATSEFEIQTHERLFAERVPLPPEVHRRIALTREERWGQLAEGVEAWGFRVMQECGCFMTREKVALAWFEEDYRPVVASLREHGLLHGGQTETEAYMDVVGERYELMRTHELSGEIMHRVAEHRR